MEKTLSKPARILLKRPILANPSSLSFAGRDPIAKPVKRTKYQLNEERRVTYYEFLKLN